MKIVILSRDAIAYLKETRSDLTAVANVISVCDPLREPGQNFLFPQGTPNVLSQEFDDITSQISWQYKLFTVGQAQEIIDFLRSMDKTKQVLLIHCTAGVARSGAIGRFARQVLRVEFGIDIPLTDFQRANPSILPNRYVLKTLRDVWKSPGKGGLHEFRSMDRR